jgi:hypothetical protein
MHLIEQYALSCGAKIGKPYIYEKFFPLPFDKYITFSPFSKPSKNYSYWKDTLSMLIPVLRQLNIHIVQLGIKKEQAFEGCYNLCGKTNINQAAYLIKRSQLHLGTDTFSTHLASASKKKIVSLYSNSPIQNCGPFWSEKEDVVLLESDREGKKHSFSTKENPRTINTIAPEKIAHSVFKLLGVKANVKNRTVKIGPKWNNEFLEVIPSSVTNFSKEVPKDRHVIRMDYHYDTAVMEEQLKVNPGLIVTNKPIPIDTLIKSRERISQVIHLIRNEEYDANFSRELERNNIPNSIYSDLKEEALKKLKYSILNLNKPIMMIEEKDKKSLPNYESLKLDKLMFRSRKFIIKEDKIYPGRAALLNDITINNFTPDPIPILDQKEFWEEMDFFWITERV